MAPYIGAEPKRPRYIGAEPHRNPRMPQGLPKELKRRSEDGPRSLQASPGPAKSATKTPQGRPTDARTLQGTPRATQRRHEDASRTPEAAPSSLFKHASTFLHLQGTFSNSVRLSYTFDGERAFDDHPKMKKTSCFIFLFFET